MVICALLHKIGGLVENSPCGHVDPVNAACYDMRVREEYRRTRVVCPYLLAIVCVRLCDSVCRIYP